MHLGNFLTRNMNPTASTNDKKNIPTIIPPWVEKATDIPDIFVCELESNKFEKYFLPSFIIIAPITNVVSTISTNVTKQHMSLHERF